MQGVRSRPFPGRPRVAPSHKLSTVEPTGGDVCPRYYRIGITMPRTDNPHLKRPRQGGRPTKLTDELIERMAEVVRVGNYLDTAARFCGVDKVTFYSWMKKGHAQKRGIYRRFLNAMEEAQASADVRDHGYIEKQSGRDWRAAVEHLRLRNPGRYGVKRLEVGGPDGQPISVQQGVASSLIELFTKLAGREDEGAVAVVDAVKGKGQRNE